MSLITIITIVNHVYLVKKRWRSDENEHYPRRGCAFDSRPLNYCVTNDLGQVFYTSMPSASKITTIQSYRCNFVWNFVTIPPSQISSTLMHKKYCARNLAI